MKPPATRLTITALAAITAAATAHTPPDPVDIVWIQPQIGLLDLSVPAPIDRLEIIRRGDDHLLAAYDNVDQGPFRLMQAGIDACRLHLWRGDDVEVIEPPAPQRRYPPAWVLGAVWYQVLPDRFCNGDPSNDPTGVQPAWNSPWRHVALEDLEAARIVDDDRPRADASPLAQTVFRRLYGGDLQGLVMRLDHLADLGVTAIYLNPVFDAPSLHKYDARDHRHVDPSLGPNGPTPAGESHDPSTWRWSAADRYLLDIVLPEARARGMHVILDGVWNHVGRKHWAFQDVRRRGSDSPYAPWFNARFAHEQDDAPIGELIAWSGWDGPNGRLPEFRQTAEGDLAPGPREHVEAITRRWMDPDGDGDPSDGVDGWRLDVVPDIGLAFWRDWNRLVHVINPDAVTIAEVWHKADAHLQGDAFDAQMNYPVRAPLLAWLNGEIDAATLQRLLTTALDHPDHVNLAQMNLLGSHDTVRIATHLGADRRAHELVTLGLAIQVALPGAPCVYNGDEWGVFGADDPHNRRPTPWPELGPYEDPPQGWVRDAFKHWLSHRTDAVAGPILRFGDWRLDGTANPDVFIVERRLNGRRVVVGANRAGEERSIAERGAIPPRSARIWVD